MGFWSKTEWEVRLKKDGRASHTIRTKLHELASALDEEPDWQTVTLTGPPGVALEPRGVVTPAANMVLAAGKDWTYDESSATVTVNLAALTALRGINPVQLVIDMEQREGVTVSGEYSCYWLGFKSRLGGQVTTAIRLPDRGTWLSLAWAKMLALIGARADYSGLFSTPNSTGRRQETASSGVIELHSSREAPGGHFIFFHRAGTVPARRAILYVTITVMLAIIGDVLWNYLVQPVLKGLGWQ